MDKIRDLESVIITRDKMIIIKEEKIKELGNTNLDLTKKIDALEQLCTVKEDIAQKLKDSTTLN
jgi:hypothetical protein